MNCCLRVFSFTANLSMQDILHSRLLFRLHNLIFLLMSDKICQPRRNSPKTVLCIPRHSVEPFHRILRLEILCRGYSRTILHPSIFNSDEGTLGSSQVPTMKPMVGMTGLIGMRSYNRVFPKTNIDILLLHKVLIRENTTESRLLVWVSVNIRSGSSPNYREE